MGRIYSIVYQETAYYERGVVSSYSICGEGGNRTSYILKRPWPKTV